jgi:hypothetical protein
MFKPIKRYHPERHYMRGPGPKWFEKHGGGINWGGPVTDSHRHDKHRSSFPACATLASKAGPLSTREVKCEEQSWQHS